MTGLPRKIVNRLSAEWREHKRWEPYREPVKIYYGTDRLPSREDLVSGGIVKCIDLADRFPANTDHANLLYLVSSALPVRRELIARAALRAGAKVVLNQNGVAYAAWAGPTWNAQNYPNRRIHEIADYVIYQSEFCRRCAMQFLGEPRGDGEVLHNPVDVKYFTPKSDYAADIEKPVFLVAGSHHEAYRVKDAIEGVRLIRQSGVDAKLVIAGRLIWSGSAPEEAHAWIGEAEMEQSVELLGAYSQKKAPDLFRRAHALIHLKIQDPCPRLVTEAMACGLPIVYSNSGGTPELVGPDAGVGIIHEESFDVMRPPERDLIAGSLLRLLSARSAMARAARTRAENLFSLDSWISAHQRIFQHLVRA